jgi:hypothetical protein
MQKPCHHSVIEGKSTRPTRFAVVNFNAFAPFFSRLKSLAQETHNVSQFIHSHNVRRKDSNPFISAVGAKKDSPGQGERISKFKQPVGLREYSPGQAKRRPGCGSEISVPCRGTTEQIDQHFSRSFRAPTIIKPKAQGIALLSLGLCSASPSGWEIGIPKIEMHPSGGGGPSLPSPPTGRQNARSI